MLRQRLRRPIILVLPAGYAQRLRELAPDLGSIRDFSLNLEDMQQVAQEDVSDTGTSLSDGYQRTTHPLSSAATTFDEAQWQEWQRLKQRGTKSRDVLWAGWRATDAALSARVLHQAEHIAAEVLDMARELATEAGATPETIRDLSVSLDNMGMIAEAQGRHDEASSLLREALLLWRRLALAFPDTAEYQTSIARLERLLAADRQE